jgi:hypothetical protein
MMDDLDDLFASAKVGVVQPSDALMARVLADADAVQIAMQQRVVTPVVEKTGFLAGLAALFGGAGVLAGVGSAAVAGLFLGFVQPSGLGSVSDLWVTASVDQIELMPGVEAVLAGE